MQYYREFSQTSLFNMENQQPYYFFHECSQSHFLIYRFCYTVQTWMSPVTAQDNTENFPELCNLIWIDMGNSQKPYYLSSKYVHTAIFFIYCFYYTIQTWIPTIIAQNNTIALSQTLLLNNEQPQHPNYLSSKYAHTATI